MFTPLCLLVSVHVALVFTVPANRDKIPNGQKVPDPCKSGHTWQPVGHLVSNMHLANYTNLNSFGQDFKGSWTNSLCHKDSDGDGNSNGVELGDTKCIWTVGSTPEGQATGHPGINEKTFDCAGIIG